MVGRSQARGKYLPERFQELLRELLKQSGETYKQASLAAGLDQAAVSRFMRGTRPSRSACIALADHFGVNPNELLQAAGYEPLRFFDPSASASDWQTPEAAEIAELIEAIPDPVIRKRVARAVKVLLRGYLGTTDRKSRGKEPATAVSPDSLT